jgi:hypothetical protein
LLQLGLLKQKRWLSRKAQKFVITRKPEWLNDHL